MLEVSASSPSHSRKAQLQPGHWSPALCPGLRVFAQAGGYSCCSAFHRFNQLQSWPHIPERNIKSQDSDTAGHRLPQMRCCLQQHWTKGSWKRQIQVPLPLCFAETQVSSEDTHTALSTFTCTHTFADASCTSTVPVSTQHLFLDSGPLNQFTGSLLTG